MFCYTFDVQNILNTHTCLVASLAIKAKYESTHALGHEVDAEPPEELRATGTGTLGDEVRASVSTLVAKHEERISALEQRADEHERRADIHERRADDMDARQGNTEVVLSLVVNSIVPWIAALSPGSIQRLNAEHQEQLNDEHQEQRREPKRQEEEA